ncbi:hypothetical protein G7Z17_g12699 [Cylindrodendrum hubeiense]|uniref:Uncharacterized protein n=1 Tax=Cylindrodendrum hubeiense TaxID=595255 RepID=A0A9P5LA23_9HYPO|nr:hypothetical protein G7Z17_g12699 [Cylindrodendrum hubeiense]
MNLSPEMQTRGFLGPAPDQLHSIMASMTNVMAEQAAHPFKARPLLALRRHGQRSEVEQSSGPNMTYLVRSPPSRPGADPRPTRSPRSDGPYFASSLACHARGEIPQYLRCRITHPTPEPRPTWTPTPQTASIIRRTPPLCVYYARLRLRLSPDPAPAPRQCLQARQKRTLARPRPQGLFSPGLPWVRGAGPTTCHVPNDGGPLSLHGMAAMAWGHGCSWGSTVGTSGEPCGLGPWGPCEKQGILALSSSTA